MRKASPEAEESCGFGKKRAFPDEMEQQESPPRRQETEDGFGLRLLFEPSFSRFSLDCRHWEFVDCYRTFEECDPQTKSDSEALAIGLRTVGIGHDTE